MDIMDKAKELGQMIAESEQYKRVIKAEIAQENSEEAQKLIKNYNQKRKESAEKMRGEQLSAEDIAQLKQQLQQEFSLLTDNEIINEYIQAKKEFEKMVQSINSVLSFYINPNEKNGCSPSKCSSCSSCG